VRILALAAGALLVAGCVAAPEIDLNAIPDRRPAVPQPELDPCSSINITTVIAKQLRVGVTEPFGEPNIFDAGPLGIQGYQVDVVNALAEQFDIRPNAVVWIPVDPAANPIEAEVDFLLSRTDERPDLAYAPAYNAAGMAFAFAPGNPFLECVTVAMTELSASGRLGDIQDIWVGTRQ
jgi:ABC-type amino acid transport substrate-binding protein